MYSVSNRRNRGAKIIVNEGVSVNVADLRDAVRTVADYPNPGVTFYDITSLLEQPDYFQSIVNEGCRWVDKAQVDKIVSVDARGFLYGAPIAYALGLPLALVRKNNKLPGPTLRKSFTTEYSTEIIEVQKGDVKAGERVVIIDDIIATGGTLKAVAELLEEAGAVVHSFAAIIGLEFCDYKSVLNTYRIHTIFDF